MGTVRQVGDGVASIWGLPQARTDELVRFSAGVLGLVMNVDTHWTDCILLGSDEGIQGGDVVWSTGRRIMLPIGDQLLGRVVSPVGLPVDGKGRSMWTSDAIDARRPASSSARQWIPACTPASRPSMRSSPSAAVSATTSATARPATTIALDTIINQRDTGVVCVYGPLYPRARRCRPSHARAACTMARW